MLVVAAKVLGAKVLGAKVLGAKVLGAEPLAAELLMAADVVDLLRHRHHLEPHHQAAHHHHRQELHLRHLPDLVLPQPQPVRHHRHRLLQDPELQLVSCLADLPL